jgi:VanZ family protein
MSRHGMPFSPGRSKEGASYTNQAANGKAAAPNRGWRAGWSPKLPQVAAQRKSVETGAMQNLLAKWLPRLAFGAFLPALALVIWGELSPAAAIVEVNFSDKALHFMAYFGLAGLLCVALKGDRRVLTATLLLAVFGGVLEMAQGYTGRDPDIFDELTNIFGAASGAGTGWAILRLLLPKTLAARVPN